MRISRFFSAGLSSALVLSGVGVVPAHAHHDPAHNATFENTVTLDKVPGVKYDLKLSVKGQEVVNHQNKVVGGPLQLEYKIWTSAGLDLNHEIENQTLGCALIGGKILLEVDPGQYAFIEYRLGQYQGGQNADGSKIYETIATDKIGKDLSAETAPAQGEYIEFEFCLNPNT